MSKQRNRKPDKPLLAAHSAMIDRAASQMSRKARTVQNNVGNLDREDA
jgi:hypothetical protein